jgi:hypothetical protein
MKYVVIKHFIDLQDNNHPYVTGEEYPRAGFKPTKKRIRELTSPENRQGLPLIKAVELVNGEI